jgi:hypothetical protein
MMKVVVSGIILALAAPSHADPESHATGAWLELAIDSSLGVAGIDDAPIHRLVIGGQTDNLAVGVALGFQYATPNWRFDIGPTTRFTLAATPEHDTELIGEGGLLVSTFSSETTDTRMYTFQGGLEVRHWLDRHLAIGGGVLGHIEIQSAGTETVVGLGAAGAFRVTGVF